jgi:S-adenosylmethionine:tRNA ribosyltransferase-isomerase
MKLSDFDYYLPKELIAQHPLDKRDSSRLMVVDRQRKTISHNSFKDLVKYMQAGDVLALNDTKVIPARIFGRKKDTAGKAEVFLTSRISSRRFRAWCRPHIKLGQEIIFDHGIFSAKMIEEGTFEFNKPVSFNGLEKIGVTPLPPYIKRIPDKKDARRYQTVYAKNYGAIASPTAGLHFTKTLLNKIKANSVRITHLTLHVGTGTFKPVKCADIREHIMEKEEFSIPEQTIKLIRSAKEKGRRIFAVGTTTTRALETLSDSILYRQAHSGYTDLFIYPGYRFKVVDCLLTNFHLPKTTLFMLVCAFADKAACRGLRAGPPERYSRAGRDLMMQAYQEAVRRRYRFYSYGDAMLII